MEGYRAGVGRLARQAFSTARILPYPDKCLYLQGNNYGMGNWEKQQEARKEGREKDKTRREKLAGYFFNLSQLAFAGLVIGWITPLASKSNTAQDWAVLAGGIAFTTVFAAIGNKILKY